ncbi:hypothetical protein PoB_000777300 [Plakobranchus ocellatus]|uniref:MULE transposase domain-containing protein n=1 Tax=Plakobranchus ocellatus TaxID=259542 RepID=A0AAV3YFS8_9GAST|nr:hypothetical protein PoB_000777300 [Plakobranchus ocellatus]
MAEISAIEAVFSGIPVSLCSFHIHQAVKLFLWKELPSASAETVMDMFMSQVYTESEEEFHSYSFCQIVPQACDDIRDEDATQKMITSVCSTFAATLLKEQLSCAKKIAYEVSQSSCACVVFFNIYDYNVAIFLP